MPETWMVASGATCFCILLIVSIILIAVSYSTLEPNQVGLDCNGNTKTIDSSQLYKGGRYFLGLGHSFIKFPTNVQETDLSLVARSRDGMSVQLSCSFQWQLVSEASSIFDLYSFFEEEYPKAFEKIAKDEIRNVAARFSSFQFFYNRSDITRAMGTGLTESIDKLGASVSGFQLLNYNLPASFAAAIQATQETGQQITRVTEEQTKTRINAEQQVATARQDAEILVVQATAAGDAFVLEKTAERDAILVTLDNERAIYKNMKTTLNLTTEQLLTLIWLSSIQSTDAPQMLNVPAPNGVFASASASN